MLSEVSCQSLGGGGPVRPLQPPVGVPQAGQGRLPAHQGGQAAKGVQEPVGQPVGPGGLQKGQGLGLGEALGAALFHWLRVLIVQPRQGLALGGVVQPHPAQAVQNPPGLIQEVDVGGPAHELGHQDPLHLVPQLAGALEGEADQPLHGGLLDAHQAAAGQVLAQEHTKHRGLVGIFGIGPGEVEPGGGGIGGNEQPLPPGGAPQQEDDGVPGGLVNLLHPGPQGLGPKLLQNSGQEVCVKCHIAPP